jgi:uncharacterized protein (TIGR00730 family)
MVERALRRVAVYCGSSAGAAPAYGAAATAMGHALSRRGMGLVYGGGNVGLMGVIADTMLAEGSEVVGVIPQRLADREVAHHGVTELVVVDTMHERKAAMAERADAFVALPGGIGTLEETFEMLTWAQLGIHDKPVGLLDVDGFYQPLLEMMDHLVRCRFLSEEHRQLVVVAEEPDALLDRLAQRQARSA